MSRVLNETTNVHNEITKATQPGQGNPISVLTGVCLVALLACVTGTALLAQAPGGVFQREPPQTNSQFSDSRNMSGSAATDYQLAATYEETNSNNDRITQAISFASPVPLSRVPVLDKLSTGGNPCGNSLTLPARDLVIPFRITSTDNTGLPVDATVLLEVHDFLDPSGSDIGGLENSMGIPEVVGEFGSQLNCIVGGISSATTTDVSVKPGQTVSVDGWIIYSGGITLQHLDGDTAALGDTFAALGFNYSQVTEVDSIKATGPGVCKGDVVPGWGSGLDANVDNLGENLQPFLHMGGPIPSLGGCTGSFSGPP